MINNKQYKQQLPTIIQKYEDSLRETKGSFKHDQSLSIDRENHNLSKNKISIRSSSNNQQQKKEKDKFLCSIIPSSKNIIYQKSKFSINTEEINKHNHKTKNDVQLLYKLITQEQQKGHKFQIPEKLQSNKSKLIGSLQKDYTNLSSDQQLLENCQYCNKSVKGQFVQIKCHHIYHYDCFQQYLEKYIKKGYPQIYCGCKIKIPQSIILSHATQLIIHRYFQNQYQKIQIKYFKYYQFEKCVNSFCNFFWIKTNESQKRKTSILQYCPNCLNKNFEIGIKMEQIFYKF